MTELAPLIAIVGADGSGKSTIAAAVIGLVRTYGQAETAHLGLKSGHIGRAIRRIPLIGSRLGKGIQGRANQARDKSARIPDPFTALVIYAFSQLRVRRFRQVLRQRMAGKIIVTDRYPQTDVLGFFDGPGLAAARPTGRFTRWLARREFRQYQWMASFRPSLVIRLNVDVETAFARKPDHRYDSLRQKVAAAPLLRYGGAPIIEFDSSMPLDLLVEEVRSAIAAGLDTLGLAPKGGSALP